MNERRKKEEGSGGAEVWVRESAARVEEREMEDYLNDIDAVVAKFFIGDYIEFGPGKG